MPQRGVEYVTYPTSSLLLASKATSKPSPLTTAAVPEIGTAIAHLRDVLGDQTCESLARKGETMTTSAMVTYAYDQMDQARAELEHSG